MNPILLIDRRAGFAHALQTVLCRAGYETMTVPVLESAYQVAAQIPCRLLIVGQVCDGLLRVTHSLKQHPATASLPLLLHSEDWSIYNNAFVRACGADGILPYPLEQTQLLHSVAAYALPPTA